MSSPSPPLDQKFTNAAIVFIPPIYDLVDDLAEYTKYMICIIHIVIIHGLRVSSR